MARLISGETLRVLMVSAREEARAEVAEILTSQIQDYRLYWVSQPDLAPVRVQDVLPHVILVDDALGGAALSTLIGQLAVRMPGAAILALVEPDAMVMARQAVLAGARGFVVKPIKAEELVETMRQVLQSTDLTPNARASSEVASGRIAVFCAPKGGTGRTTLAINTAVSLRQAADDQVALVDADYAAPALDVALNLQRSRNIGDLLPRLNRLDPDLIAGVMAAHVSGIQVLLAPPPADLSSPISLPQVQQVMAWLKRMYPWVIVDLGLPMDDTAFAFLDGADRIIMTVLPEMIGLRNTRLMLDQLRDRGYPLERIWLVLNRSNLSGGVSVGDIEQRLKVKINFQIPDDQPLATHSVNRGVPLVISHRRSALARAITQLAERLRHDMAPESSLNQPDDTRFFDRFFGRARPLEA